MGKKVWIWLMAMLLVSSICSSVRAVSSSEVQSVSDGYGGIWWNSGDSCFPTIAMGPTGELHAVWADDTNGKWGTDEEIMYATYTSASGWSNATVISDGYGGTWWNTGNSYCPDIAVDGQGVVHVVWYDGTPGWWGSDAEIMYANYSAAQGWSNATVLSDDHTQWNTGDSSKPAIAVGANGSLHVVWTDRTDGPWGTDTEIMYAHYSPGVGWSAPLVISDDETHWNTGDSWDSDVVTDAAGNVHVVWADYTLGAWGGGLTDAEIMYANYTPGSGWSKALVISDGYHGGYWNTLPSLAPAIAIGSIFVVYHEASILMVQYDAGLGWSNATTVSESQAACDADVAVDSTGMIHVVWSETSKYQGNYNDIWYRTRSSGGVWGATKDISNDASNWNFLNSLYPVLAVDSRSHAYIIWEDWTNGVWGSDMEILFYRVAPAGAIPTFNLPYLLGIVGLLMFTWLFLHLRKRIGA
jgi:hypothetical protein